MKVLFFCRDNTRVEQLVLGLRLRWPDLRPLAASSGADGLQLIEQESPEVIMLCDEMPDMGIWAAIKEVRRFSDVPLVVAVESRSESDMEIVKAIELGADDYIRLPCNLMVIMARVVALVRRVGRAEQRNSEGLIRCGELLINPATFEVFLGNKRLVLTPTEFKLLHLLAKNRHMTLSQEFIQRVIWADEAEASNVLKKYVQRLRRKLGDDARDPIWIKTVHGVGYRFNIPTTRTA